MKEKEINDFIEDMGLGRKDHEIDFAVYWDGEQVACEWAEQKINERDLIFTLKRVKKVKLSPNNAHAFFWKIVGDTYVEAELIEDGGNSTYWHDKNKYLDYEKVEHFSAGDLAKNPVIVYRNEKRDGGMNE